MKTRISRLRPGDGGFNQISVKVALHFVPIHHENTLLSSAAWSIEDW